MSEWLSLQRWRTRLERRAADPDFQIAASRGWLTRWVARRRAERLFTLCAGFTYSQIIDALERLNILDQLLVAPMPVDELADSLGVEVPRLKVLLRGAVALDVLSADEPVTLGSLGFALIGNPGLRAMLGHHRALYADLANPVPLLSGEQSSRVQNFWGYSGANQQSTNEYSRLMDATQNMVAHQLLSAVDFRKHSSVLDIGGGWGALLKTLADRYPHLECHIFDLPRVVRGVADPRLRVHSGNFHTDAFPPRLDVYLLVRVVHDHDDDAVLSLLTKVRSAMGADSMLLIVEPMADDNVVSAYFAGFFLAMGQGRLRTRAELSSLLKQAGFTHIKLRSGSLPLIARIIQAA